LPNRDLDEDRRGLDWVPGLSGLAPACGARADVTGTHETSDNGKYKRANVFFLPLTRYFAKRQPAEGRLEGGSHPAAVVSNLLAAGHGHIVAKLCAPATLRIRLT
jgi:hypothetical protein